MNNILYNAFSQQVVSSCIKSKVHLPITAAVRTAIDLFRCRLVEAEEAVEDGCAISQELSLLALNGISCLLLISVSTVFDNGMSLFAVNSGKSPLLKISGSVLAPPFKLRQSKLRPFELALGADTENELRVT